MPAEWVAKVSSRSVPHRDLRTSDFDLVVIRKQVLELFQCVYTVFVRVGRHISWCSDRDKVEGRQGAQVR